MSTAIDRARPELTRTTRTATRAIDLAGGVWAHPDPRHLYRWVGRRNDLLRAIAATPRPARA